MTDKNHILDDALRLRELGFACHWLHRKSKRPIGDDWQKKAVHTAESLRASYSAGNNLGVRLGEPSHMVDGNYLHVIDVDIRKPDLEDEALATLRELLPVNPDNLPKVRSGSGGASFHLYFVSDRPFRSKKLAKSESKHREFDKEKDRDVWRNDWEIELFGTDKQVVLPPSLHDKTHQPYVWLRPFDEFDLRFGDDYLIDADDLEQLQIPEHTTYEFESREPLDFKPGVLERLLDDLPLSRIDDRNDWILLGQAIHHQFGGSEEGFRIWMEVSSRGSKYLVGSNERKELARYRRFGKYRGRPVTMATISQWAQEARADAMVAEFEELEDLEDLDDEEAETAGRSDIRSLGDDFAGMFDDVPDNGGADDRDSVGSESEPTPAKPEDAIDDGELPDTQPLKWTSLLDVNEEGGVKGTLHNMELIVANDPRTKGVMALNEFTQEIVQRAEPGVKTSRKKAAKPTRQLTGQSWKLEDTINGDFWTEDKDNSIRSIIEAPKTQGGYSVKVSDRDLRAAIDNIGRTNCFHPVREYLQGLTWDGSSRVERLFIEYLGAPDDAYHRTVARLMLVAAVTRVHEPGHKWDTAVILEGLQGKRKSTFISTLANGWFVELDGDITDTKQIVELMQGAWIVELNELGGLAKADVRHIKAFISRRSDKVRLAYAKRAQEYRRQSILIGSTNDDVYLKDNSGGRRFLPVRCAVDQIDTERLAQELDQIWAEAYALYRTMRAKQPKGQLPLYLADIEAREIAESLQKSRTVDSSEEALAGRIAEWLDTPIHSGDIDNAEGKIRTEVCLLQIWCECLGREDSQYTGAWPSLLGRAMRMVDGWNESNKRPRFGKYGQQRAFVRA